MKDLKEFRTINITAAYKIKECSLNQNLIVKITQRENWADVVPDFIKKQPDILHQ